MKLHLAAVFTGLILDFIIGDPHSLPHPVRALGRLIERAEKKIRPFFSSDDKGRLAAGSLFAVTVLLVTGAAAAIICGLSALAGKSCFFAVDAVLSYYALAARSLNRESMKVYGALKKGNREEARHWVSMIVGRDTADLTEQGIAKAAVETVAENASDGVIAPLFYLLAGGPVAGWLYKAVNTMDSMVGYQNETYLCFGRTAAKLDDWCNLIPSRLCAVLMIGAASISGMNAGNALKIFRRDRFNHKSPNSAQTESVCAGALGVQLGGDAWYSGRLCHKPVIGDALREVETEDIKRANRLMYLATVLCFGGAAVLIILIS